MVCCGMVDIRNTIRASISLTKNNTMPAKAMITDAVNAPAIISIIPVAIASPEFPVNFLELMWATPQRICMTPNSIRVMIADMM